MSQDDGMRPPDYTPAGGMLRMAEGLGNPGNPRRALLMLGGVAALVALFVVVAVLLS